MLHSPPWSDTPGLAFKSNKLPILITPVTFRLFNVDLGGRRGRKEADRGTLSPLNHSDPRLSRLSETMEGHVYHPLTYQAAILANLSRALAR